MNYFFTLDLRMISYTVIQQNTKNEFINMDKRAMKVISYILPFPLITMLKIKFMMFLKCGFSHKQSFRRTKNSFAPLKEYKCHTPIINSDLPMLKDAFGL